MRSITNTAKDSYDFIIGAISKPLQNRIAGISACRWLDNKEVIEAGIFVWNLDVGNYWYVKLGKPVQVITRSFRTCRYPR